MRSMGPQEASKLNGRDLILESKKRMNVLIVSLLATASLFFAVQSVFLRGLSKDLLIFGAGALFFLGAVLVIKRNKWEKLPGNIALIPITFLLPMAVFFPLPTDPNDTALFTLALSGALSMVLGLLIGYGRVQILIPGLVSIALTITFFAIVLVPSFPIKADPQWAISNLIAAVLIQVIIMSALLYSQNLFDRALREIEFANEGLASQVEERTLDLRNLNEALQEALKDLSSAQSQLVLSERLKLLGEMVAGVNHEINTPLGAIVSSARTLETTLNNTATALVDVAIGLRKKERALLLSHLSPLTLVADNSTLQIRKAKRRAEEKLAALGHSPHGDSAELLAWVGREEIGRDLERLFKRVPVESLASLLYSVGTLHSSIASIRESALRISGVTQALRQNSAFPNSEERDVLPLHRSLDSVLSLMKYRLDGGVEFVRQYDETLHVRCHSGRLGQAWMNIILNAIQAMDGKGTLFLSSRKEEHLAIVEIGNTGPEIPVAIRDRIFQPFVTTKDPSVGTGLGLSIARQIVEEHGGVLSFETSPNRTTFIARLPIYEGSRTHEDG